MSVKRAATVDRTHEPNALPHEIHCACCPRKVSILTRTYTASQAGSTTAVTYCEPSRPLNPISVSTSEYQAFIRGLLLEVTSARSHAWLKKYELPSEATPHDRSAYRLPTFALEVGKVIWVCPTCEDVFHGHAFNVEQYLAERQWMFNNMGELHFKLSNSF